jgi:hypothetical protein
MSDTTISITNNEPSPHDALEQIRPEIAALDESKLHPIKLETLLATGTVRGSLPKIMQYRAQLIQEVPKFDISKLDKLGLYALALVHTQTAYTVAYRPPEALAALGDEVTQLREQLLSDATALVNRGLLNGGPLDVLKGPSGYRNAASDLMALALLLRTNWSAISSKSCVSEVELDRADKISIELLDAVGTREQNPVRLATVALERQKAYTLFMDAYDQVRRAIHFLRWNEDDADTIAPSLYAGRSASHKKATSDIPNTSDAPTTQASPTTNTTTPTTPTTNATPAATPRAAVGLPGGDPFAC